MSEQTPEVLWEGFFGRFETDLNDLQTSNMQGSIGRGRVAIREKIMESMRVSCFKLELKMQVTLIERFAKELVQRKEYGLAEDCFKYILTNLEPALIVNAECTQVFKSTTKASIAYQRVFANYKKEVGSSAYSRISPIAVTRLLLCLQDLRAILKTIFEELPAAKDQEEVAWLILNGCKLILQIAQPLVWLSCSRYVTDSIIFASLCMEAVVNLCTCRHLKFRMKLYTTAFYSTMAGSGADDSQRMLEKISKELNELRDREYIDPPVPEKVEIILLQADMDLAAMRAVHNFWADPDSLASGILNDDAALREKFEAPAVNNDYKDKYASIFGTLFTERVLCEYIRVHQLTSGNINEPYKRRTVAILRGFDALSASFPTREVEVPRVKILVHDDADAGSGNEEEKASTVTVTDCALSNKCLLELLAISQFEELPEGSEECDVLSIQKKIFSYTKTKSAGADTVKSSMKVTFDGAASKALLNGNEDTDAAEALLLEQLAVLVALSQGKSYIDQMVATVNLVQAVDKILYSAVMPRRKGFLRNLSISLWQHGVYPQLQRALSDLSTESLLPLKVMSTTLVCLVKTLDLSKMEDPLLLASLSLVTARILGHFGDLRGAIALLQQSVETIDEHRAARVDLALHMPVDTRDISALQRASITTQAEAQDWYHSVKRLGAHAFAGFGVFGAGSQTERTDLALGELHADIIALYFRYELEYAIERRHMRHKMKAKLWTKDGRRVKPGAKRGAALGQSQEASLDVSSTDAAETMEETAMPFGMKTIIQFDEEALGQVKKFATDQLPVVAQLKSWCERNTYARAILNVELARIEKSTEKVVKLLNDACRLVEENELEEEAVKASLSDLTLLNKDPHLRAPLIIARSHKFIYTVPVGSKGLQDKKPVDYYRIFCKEEKNASLVTLINDELDGCEKRVSVQALNVDNQLCECVSRIGNLRWGQKYVFAAGAFDAKNKNVGAIGPTSVGITAVNPLPNLLIWTYIYQVASDLAIPTTKSLAAGHVCDRFFLANPNQGSAALSFGKGINVLVGEEPAVCMLAVQQASPVTLAAFVAAYLALLSEEKPGSTLTGPVNSANKGVPEGMRRTEQWKVLTQLRRICTVSVVACYSQQVDLVVQCLVKGHELAASLLFSDERHLGNMLQNPLITLLVVLQSVPKCHWHELEHNLYCRLLHHVLKLAISNRSTASVVPLLNRVFEEADKQVLASGQKNEVNVSSQTQYIALERLVRRESAIYGQDKVAGSSAEMQFNAVFETLIAAPAEPAEPAWYNPNQGYTWQRAKPSVIHSILESGRDAVLAASGETAAPVKGAPPPAVSKAVLTGNPELMSDLLAAFVTLIKSIQGVEEDKEAFKKTVACLPIYDKLLAPEVLAAHEQWDLGLVKPLPEQPEEPEEPVDPDAEPVEEDESTPQKIKKKFDPLAQYAEVTADEKNAQLCALGEICFLRALRFTAGTDDVKRNYFPDTKNGPEMTIDMTDASLFVALPEMEASESPRDVDAPFGKIDYVRNMGAALSMYATAECPAAACGVATRLWNFIVDQWVSPAAFAKEYVSLHANLTVLLSNLIGAIKFLLQNCGGTGLNSAYELQSSLADLGDKDNNNNTVAMQKTQAEVLPAPDETITPLVVEDLLNSAQFILIFMVKVQWLHKQMFNVIDYGSAVMDCYLSANKPALCKNVGETCMPLVVQAQEFIIEGVEGELVAHQKSADDCVHAFEELMKKKRRKKTRVAKVEKDDDDIRHESEMEDIQRLIDETESRLEFNKERLRLLKLQFKRFETLYPTGIQLLNKVRVSRNSFLQDCYSAFGSESNENDTSQFGQLVQEHAALTQMLDEVLDSYDQVTNFLREKKDKIALIEALREQGDLLLLFGMNSQARNIWHDGLDGLFNTMDSYKTWKEVSSGAIHDMYAHQDVEMLNGMVTAVDVLAKLSKYCAASDWDMKTNYTRFAAELCRAPFMESYGHPVSLLGFAAYVCKDLGGSYSFILPSDKVVLASLALSLEEVVNVMKDNNLFMQALPVVVLLEHIHSSYTHRAELWLNARLLRVKLLISSRLFAQAASMLATAQYSITTLTNHTFNDLLVGAGPVLDKGFDTSANGLDFHGKAPFFNHLPPDDEQNKVALDWIGTFATEFETFLATFQVTDSQGEEKMLFPAPIISEAAIQVGRFLIEVSLLDGKVTASHSAFLAEQGDKGLAILQEVTATKIGGDRSNDHVFPYQRWIKQYCACVLLKSDVLIKRRQPMEARRHLVKLLELLQTNNVKTYISVDTKAYMAYTWLQARDKLADIAMRQYRLNDAIKLCTLAVEEASVTCNGYWIRSLLLRRAIASYKLGKLSECRTDCDTVLRLYDHAMLFDAFQLRCLSLKCSILRDMLSGNISLDDDSSHLTDSSVLDATIGMLHTAYTIAEKMCNEVGFLGADVNVTFNKTDSNVAKHHYLPPLLHSLTSIHQNEPELTKKYHEKLPRKNDGKPNTYAIKQKLRPGPIDSDDKKFSQSEYVNIYLKEVKLLADCHAALTTALDEKRELEEVVDSAEISQTLLDQTSFGENALKLLRHIVFASPHTRSTLLHLVGRSRAGMSDNLPTVTLGNQEEKISPFSTSLDLARTSAHDWYLMRRSCIQLVSYFYDQATATGPLGAVKDPRNAKANLAKASQFMVCGVKLGKQIRTIEKDSVRVLAADKTSFGAAPSAELAKLLDSGIRCSSSSEQTMRSIKGAAAPDAAVDPKAKGKPPAGGAAIPASSATARDAVFMLSSIMLDFEDTYLDTEDRNDYCDVDKMLKTQYPHYNTLCNLAATPKLDSAEAATVAADSLSSLWVPIKTVNNFPQECLHANFGRFSHVAGYFLFGGATPSIKRLIAQRADIVHVRKGLFKLQKDLSFALANPGAEGDQFGACAAIFAKILELLCACFRDGYIDESIPKEGQEKAAKAPPVKCVVSGDGAATTVNISIPSTEESAGADATEVVVAMSEEIVSALADLLCCDKDVDAVVQASACTLVRALMV